MLCLLGKVSAIFTDAVHFTPYFFSISAVWSNACLFPCYQIATLAPASANACTTCSPIPAPEPDTIAVLCFRLNSWVTWVSLGAFSIILQEAAILHGAVLRRLLLCTLQDHVDGGEYLQCK